LQLIKDANLSYNELTKTPMILAVSEPKPRLPLKQTLILNPPDTNQQPSKSLILLNQQKIQRSLQVSGNTQKIRKVAVLRRSSIVKDNSQQIEESNTDKFNKLINFNLDDVIDR
jgi:hypothetical protein